MDIGRLRDQDPHFRAVVFSQFTSFLDLIEATLKRDQFSTLRYDGSLSLKERTEVVEEFAKVSGKPKVLAMSLKAGGIGLNVRVSVSVEPTCVRQVLLS